VKLQAGDFVDRYRILASLGAGGMGEVYRAHDTRLQRDVALKILHTEASSGMTTGGAARLLREARSVAALEHPNIITIYDVGEIAEPETLRGTPYIAMELIRGKSLRDIITGPTASLAARVGWLVGAAQGLAAAHKHGIVHRDVKPENIMVREDGVVKVLDFGIAKRSYSTAAVDPTSSTEAQLLPRLSTKGVVVGTPFYMAPEQMRSEPLDGRADQFSWGVVAYEVLAGKPPWSMGGDALQLVSEILSKAPLPPRALNAEIPPYVEAVVIRAMAKSSSDRFPSMNAVVDLLVPGGASSQRSLPLDTSPFAQTAPFVPSGPVAAVPVASGETSPPASAAARAGVPSLDVTPTATERAKRPAWGWGVGLAALLAVAIAGGTAYRHRASPGPSPSAAGSSSPAPSAGSEVGSTVPTAVRDYRAALAAFRDADIDRARRELDDALREDPKFAAAHLRYGMTKVPPSEAERTHLREAARLRASLDPHDQALANAFATLSSVPGDFVEAEKRLAKLVDESPSDADFALQLCRLRNHLERKNAIDTCRRASELDPGAAAPFRLLALTQVKAGDVRSALASFDACLRNFSLATSCLMPLLQLQELEGNCEGALASARRLVSADPESPEVYEALAEVLLGSGAPLEGVKGALDEEFARLPPADAKLTRVANDALIAIRTGDFVRADEKLRAWDEALATNNEESDHYGVTLYRILLELEEGHANPAKSLASAYLRRRAAWNPSPDDHSLRFDGALYRVGAITREEFALRRTKWLAKKKAESGGSDSGFVWVEAYAQPSIDADDAREALAVLPDYLPLPNPMERAPDFELPIGEVYRLAERESEAVPFLTRAANACVGREAPFEQTWGSLALGKVREKLGDREAACEAYRVVRGRWKTAAESVSVRYAEARSAALRCTH
jgi:serine/threonine protein kinase/tetratricopeptide (TPR) repeat protein